MDEIFSKSHTVFKYFQIKVPVGVVQIKFCFMFISRVIRKKCCFGETAH